MTSIISSSLYQSLQDGALLVTANRRLSRSFAAAFNQHKIDAGESSWPTPGIVPLDAWWQSLHASLTATGELTTRLLSDEQELALWIRSVEKSGDSGALLSLSATARELMKSWRIEQAYRAMADPWSHYLTDDQRAYRRWSALFEQYCAQAGFIDMARLPDHIFDKLVERAQHNAPIVAPQGAGLLPSRLILTGFSRITPQLQAVLDRCSELGVQVMSPYLPDPVAGHVVRTECADAEHELRMAALWARESVTAESGETTAGRSTAVVIADLHLRRAEVERAFDAVFFPGATPAQISKHGRPYELSLGLPLSQYAPVASALQVLELGFNCLSGSGISEFLLSPYLRHATSEKDRRSLFDSTLRAAGVRSLHLHQLLEMNAPRGLLALLKSMHAASSQSPALPSVWLKRLVNMLDAAGWPGETPPQSIEYQAIEAWHDCVEDVVHLDEMVGKINSTRMLALVRQVTDSRVFQPQTPALPVQVMGTLESAGLQFDALWLTGFDNENWPPVQRASPFLPLKWQKSVTAPGASPDYELSVSRELVEVFSVSAHEVVFSYPAARNSNEVDVSVQIAALPEQPVSELAGEPPASAMRLVFESLACESVDDQNGPAVDPDNPVKGGTRLFEDQAKCPFRAFALHRLQARPLEEPVLGIDARDKGNFFHDTMEFFWHETASHENLAALSEEALAQRIRHCIEQAMSDKTTANQQPQKAALLAIEQQRLQRVVQKWIHHFEKTRAPFVVEKMEEDEHIEFESLQLRLKLDRVDRLTDGGRVIIDYKTGKNNSIASWTDDRISSAQLPLYAIVMKDIHAVCFAQVAVNKQRFLGMGKEKGLLPGLGGPANDDESWAQRLDTWRDNLAAIAREIREGYAAVTPTGSACQFCELPALCRIDSNALVPEDELDARFAGGETPAVRSAE